MSAPGDPRRAFARAMDHHRARDLGLAETGYREVLGRVPGHVPALLNLAALLTQTRRVDEAAAMLRRAINADPSRSEASLALALLLTERAEPAEAVAVLDAARERIRHDITLGVELARVLLAWGRSDADNGACARAESVAAALGDAAGARGVRIEALVTLDRQGEARAVLNGLLTVPPGREAALAVLGWLRAEAGPQPGAEQALGPFLSDNPASAAMRSRAHAAAARMLRQVRLHDWAQRMAREGVRLDPACVGARLELARASLVLGDPDEAQRALEAIAADDRVLAVPASKGDDRARKMALFELGRVLDQRGQHDRAFACVTRAKASLLLEPDARTISFDEYPAFVAARVRWIESCEVSSWPTEVPAKDDRPDPVFFVGFPRSGTTLTEQILASHPALGVSGETPILGRAAATMRRRLGAPGHALADTPDWLDGLTDEQVLQLRDEYFEQVTRELGPAASGGRLVDKLPLNIVRLPIIRRVFPRARVLVALRDPRDVCISCLFQLFGLNRAMVHFFDLSRTVALYQQVMELYLAYRDRLGLTLMESRYEDLVADTPGQARRIIEFLGLEWDDRVLDFHERASERVIATPSADQVTQRVYSTSVARWKRYEGVAEGAFESLGPIAEQLGYDGASDSRAD